jgi:glycosyltransferase involved in cell wall biosynthesis
MFVFNDCRNDARVLREAATLAGAGHTLTIMALPSDLASRETEREGRDGVEIVRVPIPRSVSLVIKVRRDLRIGPGRIRRWAVARARAALRNLPAGLPDLALVLAVGLVSLPAAVIWLPFAVIGRLRPATRGGGDLHWFIRWRWLVLGWARLAARAAPASDIWHGHDLTGLAAAIEARRLRGGQLVYDSHEIYVEAGAHAHRANWVRSLLESSERRWNADAAALVTVNDALAAELGRRLAPRRTVVVHNCPARWTPPAERPDLIRKAAGIRADAPIALYHGGFSLNRGMEQLAQAILEPGLERVHAVYLGYGVRREALLEMAAEPRFAGRLHVLDAVRPDELLPWVASADVGVMTYEAVSLNNRLSTPNKLFECLAAGVPVISSDFPDRRQIVLGDPAGPLGAVCQPDDVADVARAIQSILDLPIDERDALRARCLQAAHERWNWEKESAKLVALYAELSAGGLTSPGMNSILVGTPSGRDPGAAR